MLLPSPMPALSNQIAVHGCNKACHTFWLAYHCYASERWTRVRRHCSPDVRGARRGLRDHSDGRHSRSIARHECPRRTRRDIVASSEPRTKSANPKPDCTVAGRTRGRLASRGGSSACATTASPITTSAPTWATASSAGGRPSFRRGAAPSRGRTTSWMGRSMPSGSSASSRPRTGGSPGPVQAQVNLWIPR